MKKLVVSIVVVVMMLCLSTAVYAQIRTSELMGNYNGPVIDKSIKIPDYRKSTLYQNASTDDKVLLDKYIDSVMLRATGIAFRAAYDMTLIASKINVNTASKETLMLLPGVGTKTADNIITTRELKNGFVDIKGLLDVSGIGDKRLALITPFVFIETSE